MWTLGLLWVAALSHTMIAASPYVEVDTAAIPIGHLHHFWANTGFSPPGPGAEAEAFLLSRDVRAALALLAAVPQRALGRVRVHWLLELVRPAHANTGRGRSVGSSTVSTLLDAVHGGRGDDIGMERHGEGGAGKGYFEANSTSRGGPGGKIGKRQRGDAGDGESGFRGSMGSVRDETDDDVGGREERDIGHHVAMAPLGGGGERRGGRSHCGGKIEKELHLENSSLCSVSEDALEVGSLSERHGKHVTAGRGDEISRGRKGDRHDKNIGLKGKNRDRSPESFPSFAQKDRKKSTKGKLKANATPGGMSPKNKRVPAKNSSISDVVDVRPRRGVGVGELDWAQLDALLDWMHARDLALGFELMGNPAGRFRDLARPEEARAWRRFVARLLRRYLDRYGSEAIARWRFETWNEPDLRKYNTLNFTLPGFARYARASAAGLRAGARARGLRAAPGLAGPAGLFKRPRARHPLCWGLVRRCARRPRACPLAQLSFHRKGGGAAGGFADGVVGGGAQLLRTLRRRFPGLAALPVANTEADPESGWWRAEEWRADARYAAMVARAAAESQRRLVHQLGVDLVASANDNAFLSDAPHHFTQRTLLARFQMNSSRPAHTQWVGKPVYAALALMGLLGERELAARVRGFGGRAPRRHLAVLAATGGGDGGGVGEGEGDARHAAVLLAWGGGADPAPADWANVTVALKGLSEGAAVAVWQVDERTDPWRVWRAAGAPGQPDGALRAAMRAAAAPRLDSISEGGSKSARASRVLVALPPPAGVALVQACERPAAPPGAPSRLLALDVTAGEVLLLWSDEHVRSRCLLEYEVQFRGRREDGWRRVSPATLRLLSFHFAPLSSPGHAPPSAARQAVRGHYRVRAVDFWGRPGNFSQQLAYG